MQAFEDFNHLAFEQGRQGIIKLRGDSSLLDLSNEEMVKALRLVETRNGLLLPNIAGLLLLGRIDSCV